MVEIKVTNLVKFYVLLLLNEKPKHGYEMIKEVEEKIGKKVSAGEIYPFLKLLRKYGYIESRKTEAREKKVYYLTGKGRGFVKKILERFGDLIDIAIKPRLSVCSHCGCEIYRGGYKGRIKGKELVFCCMHCANSYKRDFD
jgi:DNA-binding PadR family transcriptional regulator